MLPRPKIIFLDVVKILQVSLSLLEFFKSYIVRASKVLLPAPPARRPKNPSGYALLVRTAAQRKVRESTNRRVTLCLRFA